MHTSFNPVSNPAGRQRGADRVYRLKWKDGNVIEEFQWKESGMELDDTYTTEKPAFYSCVQK